MILIAGASEMLMANAVSKLAARTPGKEAVAIEAYAKALRTVRHQSFSGSTYVLQFICVSPDWLKLFCLALSRLVLMSADYSYLVILAMYILKEKHILFIMTPALSFYFDPIGIDG